MLTRIFGRKSPAKDKPVKEIAYGEQKEMAQAEDESVRLGLAQSQDTRPEILYYLASDSSRGVRQAIATNPSTPVQADAILAEDRDGEVRTDLARKIGRLMPDMPAEEQARIRDLTLEMLESLADDQLPRVRAVISEELKHTRNAPKHIIRKLAADVEAIVSAPILEFSPLLSDADLKEIMAAGTANEALAAIARRAQLSEDISDAVVATLDVPAVAALLANESAQIREETLDIIVENADQIDSWHEPLVVRPELSVRAMRRIAGFVAASLIELLAERNDLDPDFAAELGDAVRKRLNNSTGALQERGEKLAEKKFKLGELDDDFMLEAMEAGQTDFSLKALSLLSRIKKENVAEIMESRDPKVITAVIWKAGLSMRTAMRFQAKMGRIAPHNILNARGGLDYPISEEDMAWCLDAYS